MSGDSSFADLENIVDRLIERASDLSTLYPNDGGAPRLSVGGKRVRSRLLLLAALGMGVADDVACHLAAALEMIHNASLFHDDVVDAAPLRRGETTLHVSQGNRLAIMSGDVCFSRAMTLVCRARHLQIYDRVAAGMVALSSGQLQEGSHRGDADLTAETYFQIVDGKTGALFSLALVFPGILAGAGDSRIEKLHEAGLLIGRMFQLADDMLDIGASESVTGKEPFRDLAEGKLTLPYLVLMEKDPKRAHLIRDHLERGGAPAEPILQWAEEAGLNGALRDLLESWMTELDTMLRGMFDDQSADALMTFSRRLAFRDH